MVSWSIVLSRRYLVMLSTYLLFSFRSSCSLCSFSFFLFLSLLYFYSTLFVLHQIQNGGEEGEVLVLIVEVLQQNRCFFLPSFCWLLNRLSLLRIIAKMCRHWKSPASEDLNYSIIISIIIDDTILYLCFCPRFS